MNEVLTIQKIYKCNNVIMWKTKLSNDIKNLHKKRRAQGPPVCG